MLLGRAIMGLSVGAAFVCVGLYIVEVVPAGNRGCFMAFEGVFFNIGISGAYWVSYGLSFTAWASSWRLPMGLAAVVPLTCLPLLAFPSVPESPRWLLQMGKE